MTIWQKILNILSLGRDGDCHGDILTKKLEKGCDLCLRKNKQL